MRFVANLRAPTVDAFAAESIQPRAYLLSSHRATPAALALAARVRAMGLPLIADNGTKALIEEVVDAHDGGQLPCARRSGPCASRSAARPRTATCRPICAPARERSPRA